jgi:hypothetical protein
MVQVVVRQQIRVEWRDIRGMLHYRTITRRAIATGGGLHEFRYQGKRCWARRVDGQLVCDPGLWARAYPYTCLRDITAA